MISKNYIMRMVEQLSFVLMKIIRNKENKNYAQALLEIDSAYKNILGFDPWQIKNMSESEIYELLKSDDGYDAEKSIVIAELLRHEAEIIELQSGFNDTVFNIFLKSFFLYIEAIIFDGQYNQAKYLENVAEFTKKISLYELPAHIKFQLFRYYEVVGGYGKAEDILYELIDLNYAGIYDAGRSFYLRLMDKPEADLK
jgi:hypothetical protein